MTRISIVGPPGAGKSTLAVALGKVLELEVVPIDLHFWTPMHRECPRSEQETALSRILLRPDCILEGGFPWTYKARADSSDLMIWLDIEPHVRLFNMLRRHWFLRSPVGQHPVGQSGRKTVAKPHALSGLFRQQRVHWRSLEQIFAAPPLGCRVVRLHSLAAARGMLAEYGN